MMISRLKWLVAHLQTNEHGVSAVFIALAMIMMMGFVALGIDISLHTHERQELWDTLDASSLAGAQLLPDAVAAEQAARDYAEANWPGINPDIDFYCVVGVDDAGDPDASQIPFMCDPGPGPYNVGNYPGLDCNSRMCLIPCNPAEGDTCNTIRVRAQSVVNYAFAPVIGFDQGSTGVLASASCKGPCGAEIDVPGDIALVLDRTGSMGAGDVTAMKSAATAFVQNLDLDNQHVALGTIGASDPEPSCPTTAVTTIGGGTWVPIDLTDDLADLLHGIDCLDRSSTQTNLGDSVFAAGMHLVNDGRDEAPDGVVFMTDGEANQPNGGGGGNCDYAEQRAQSIKSAEVIVVTIAYRLQGVDCEGNPATTVLANMASDPESGGSTLDDHGGCVGTAAVSAENADGDLFFCAPDPGLLSSVFSQASSAILAQFAERTILVKPPA